MTSKHIAASLAVALLVCGLFIEAADGALVITVQEEQTSVIATFSGELDLSGLTLSVDNGLGSGGVRSSSAAIASGDSILGGIDIYVGLTEFPYSMGTNEIFFHATSFTGDRGVGVQRSIVSGAGRIAVPNGYISGEPLQATATWESSSLESLGLLPGTYEWTWIADRAEVRVIPEPSTAMLIGIGAVFVVVGRCRQSKCRTSRGWSTACPRPVESQMKFQSSTLKSERAVDRQ